ncbi:MAG: hypothetical protein AABW45_02670, partial [Nanoarchaeota archaeon]
QPQPTNENNDVKREGNLTIQNNVNNVEEESFVKKMLNTLSAITGKITFAGKTEDEKNAYIVGLITLFSILVLIIYQVFFKK